MAPGAMAIATLILIKAALANRPVIPSTLGCLAMLAVCRSHSDVMMPVQRSWTRLEQQKPATVPGLTAGWIVADLIARLVALAFAILPAIAVTEPITLKLSFFSSDRSGDLQAIIRKYNGLRFVNSYIEVKGDATT
jgi:hypothetical protein